MRTLPRVCTVFQPEDRAECCGDISCDTKHEHAASPGHVQGHSGPRLIACLPDPAEGAAPQPAAAFQALEAAAALAAAARVLRAGKAASAAPPAARQPAAVSRLPAVVAQPPAAAPAAAQRFLTGGPSAVLLLVPGPEAPLSARQAWPVPAQGQGQGDPVRVAAVAAAAAAAWEAAQQPLGKAL